MLLERKRLEGTVSDRLGSEFDREYDGFVCRDNLGKLIEPNFVTGHFKTKSTQKDSVRKRVFGRKKTGRIW